LARCDAVAAQGSQGLIQVAQSPDQLPQFVSEIADALLHLSRSHNHAASAEDADSTKKTALEALPVFSQAFDVAQAVIDWMLTAIAPLFVLTLHEFLESHSRTPRLGLPNQ